MRGCCLVGALILSALPGESAARPQGLGGGLATLNPKAMAVESDLLNAVNALRRKSKQQPLAMEMRLRLFARKEAEGAARGDPTAGAVHDRVKQQGMAPYGYFLQSVYGTSAADLLKRLRADAATRAALVDSYAKAGIGAFYVPADPPYFQVLLLLAAEPDPMAGKPGLSTEQTNPVIQRAMPAISRCYDRALERNPNLRGKVLFSIVIGGDGRATETTLLNSLGEADLDVCMLQVVRGLQFPKPYKGKAVTLNHPIQLQPPQGDKVVGKLTAAQIRATFDRATFELTQCYEGRLAERPRLAGKMVLALTVLATGEVTRVRFTEDALGDGPLAQCILAVATALRFPRPSYGGEVDVTYPLNFEPPKKAK